MLTRQIILVFTILVITSRLALSQEPPSSGREDRQPEQAQTQQRQQMPANDQRGSDQSPLVIKILPPQNTDTEATKPPDQSGHKSFTASF